MGASKCVATIINNEAESSHLVFLPSNQFESTSIFKDFHMFFVANFECHIYSLDPSANQVSGFLIFFLQ
jgi:hypothetical protein